MKDFVILGIWAALIGGLFVFAWRKGYLLRLANYVGETREELKKCTWPSVDELKGSTVVIIVSILLMGLYTVGIDFVILKIVRALL